MTPRDRLQRLLFEHRTAHDPASSEREILAMFEALENDGYLRGLRDAPHLPNPLDPANNWPKVVMVTSGTTSCPDWPFAIAQPTKEQA